MRRRRSGDMATHVLRIDNWWPTRINVLMRSHYHARNRLLKQDAEVIGLEALRQHIPRATGRRRVSLLIRYKNHALDPDGALKSLFDGLTVSGLILDDNRHQLEMGWVRYEKATRKGVEIVLEDLDQ